MTSKQFTKDLEKFQKTFRSATSADLQAFTIGYQTALEKKPNPFDDIFKPIDFPEILLDLYRNGNYVATYNENESLQFRLWFAKNGTDVEEYYFKINPQFHSLFYIFDNVKDFKNIILSNGNMTNNYPSYKFNGIECQVHQMNLQLKWELLRFKIKYRK